MKYIVYDPVSGEIIVSGECSVPDARGMGTLMEDTDGANGTQYVLAGVLTAYTAAQAAAKAVRPAYDCTWDNTAMAWQDIRDLSDAQSQQLDVLTAAYQTAIAQNVTFTTAAGTAKAYQADAQSTYNAMSSMLGCQAAQATPAGFYWVAADNTQVPFTFPDLQALAAAMFAQGVAAFAKLQALKATVRAATTTAAVRAVSW